MNIRNLTAADLPAVVFVKAKSGKVLMPSTRRRHILQLLKKHKASLISECPFQIQLNYETAEVCQPLYIGVDPGRTNIATVVMNKSGRVLMAFECETNNKDVPKHMLERKLHKKSARFGARAVRKRRAIKNGTTIKGGFIERKLPHYDKPVVCKIIRHAESRFCNRRLPEGWQTPTVRHLIGTFGSIMNQVSKYCPVKEERPTIGIEYNTFYLMDSRTRIQAMYSKPALKGFDRLKRLVSSRQHGVCLMCGGPIEEYHHIVPKAAGGSDAVQNRVGLCRKCHYKVHKDKSYAARLNAIKRGLSAQYAALSVLNQAMMGISYTGPFLAQRKAV